MACGTCNGYYVCWCDIIKINTQIYIKELELESLKNKKEKIYKELCQIDPHHIPPEILTRRTLM